MIDDLHCLIELGKMQATFFDSNVARHKIIFAANLHVSAYTLLFRASICLAAAANNVRMGET